MYTSVAVLYPYVCAWENMIPTMWILLPYLHYWEIFQGAKPYIYCDTTNNQTPQIHNYSESDHQVESFSLS